LPIALGQHVQLLGNSSPSASNFQVELLKVLIKERNRDVFRANVRWVSRPWNFPQWKQSPGLLLLNPQYIDFHMSKLRNALTLHYADRSAGIHADASSHGRAATVGKKCENPECLRRGAHNGV
jgi:hypothetical protein